jgi:adenylate cyclase class 2
VIIKKKYQFFNNTSKKGIYILIGAIMAIEIELKAHVSYPGIVKTRISALAGSPASIEKEDAYWRPQSGEAHGLPPSGVRIRKEVHTGPGGDKKEQALVTYKAKELQGGIEINEEWEFTVSDDTVFRDLLRRLGLVPGLWKYKKGWSWSYRGITVELCEVSGSHSQGACPEELDLGWFAELELLADNDRAETTASAHTALLGLLEEIGIGADQIEERYYSEMLRNG